MDFSGAAPIVDDERAAAYRLCAMCVDLTVRIHRAGYVPAAMRAQQHAVLRAALRDCPHRGNLSGIGFDVIDAAWFASDPLPLIEHVAKLIERHFWIRLHRRHPPHVNLIQLLTLFACHLILIQLSPVRSDFLRPRTVPTVLLRRPDRARAPAVPPCRRIRARAPASPPRRRSASPPRFLSPRSRRGRTNRASRSSLTRR